MRYLRFQNQQIKSDQIRFLTDNEEIQGLEDVEIVKKITQNVTLLKLKMLKHYN